MVLPDQSERVTAEAELALIIGREAKDVSEEEAPSVVSGFTTVLDMTAEDILRKNPRYLTRSKSFDTFFSFGPELVTPDEIADVGALEVSHGPQRRGPAHQHGFEHDVLSVVAGLVPLAGHDPVAGRHNLDGDAGGGGHTGGRRGRVPHNRLRATLQPRRPAERTTIM